MALIKDIIRHCGNQSQGEWRQQRSEIMLKAESAELQTPSCFVLQIDTIGIGYPRMRGGPSGSHVTALSACHGPECKPLFL